MSRPIPAPKCCAECTTRMACHFNDVCKLADSAKAEAAAPAPDAPNWSQSARAEIERLTSALAIQSKLTRDAEKQRDAQTEYTKKLIAENDLLTGKLALQSKIARDAVNNGTRLRAELIAANDSLIAARDQIAALVADQRENVIDRARELREYVTTRQFHQQQASMAPSRGVSIPAAELDVTEQEDEAFKIRERNALLSNLALNRLCTIPTDQLLKMDTAALQCIDEVLRESPELFIPREPTPARTSAEIRLDDIEHRMERAENAYLVLQGRVNTHNDRLDGLKGI